MGLRSLPSGLSLSFGLSMFFSLSSHLSFSLNLSFSRALRRKRKEQETKRKKIRREKWRSSVIERWEFLMQKEVRIYRRESVGSKGDSQEMTHREWSRWVVSCPGEMIASNFLKDIGID